MSKKGYLVEPDGGHYSYKVKSDMYGYAKIVRLFFSKIGIWTEKYAGKQYVKAETNGDFDTTFTFNTGKVVTLDVCELNAIHQICNLMNSECNGKAMCQYRNVKKV